MANPKKKLEEQVTIVEEESKPQADVCGHVNKQHYGANGKLADLACDLPEGHAGDHHAKYMANIGEPEHDNKGRVTKVTYHEEERDAWWNDAAGKVAKPANGVETMQTTLLQKDIIMQVLSKNPTLTAEEALKRAKENPAWNIPNEPGS